MDQEEGPKMAKMNTNDDMHHEHEHRQPLVEVPPANGPERPPIRNDDNATCHCGNCACPCARPGGGNGGGGAGLVEAITTEPGEEKSASKPSSEAGDPVNDGDEGVEDHLIEVGDFGYIPLSLIHRTLAKHARCTCHGVLPSSEDYPFSDSPIISGMVSSGADSMIVELSSGEPSMASSGLFSIRSRGSSVFEYMHGGFDHNAVMEAFPTLYNPLQLTAEIRYPMQLSLSSVSEGDYRIPADDFGDHDRQ